MAVLSLKPPAADIDRASLPPELQIFSENEAAQIMLLSPRTLQRLRAEGGGPRFLRLTPAGARIAYRLSDIRKWLDFVSVIPGSRRRAGA